MREKIIEIDEINITPSDFTVWIKGIPYDTDFKDLQRFIENNSYPGTKAEVVAVSPAYLISDYVAKVREKKALQNKINYLREYKLKHGEDPKKETLCFSSKYPTEEELNADLAEVTDWQNQFENKTNLMFSQGTCAFITYKKQTDCKETIDYWHEGLLEKCSQMGLLCFHKYAYSERMYRDNLISIEQAPEPSDIIWENLDANLLVKIYRRLQTGVFTAILIIISFCLVLGIKIYEQDEYRGYINNGQKVSNSENIKLKAISFGLSLVIQFMNNVISISVRFFSGYEKHATWTKFNVSVFHKLVTSTTLNTVFVIYVVNSYAKLNTGFNPTDVDTKYWFSQDYGISSDLYSLLLVDAFVTPVILLFAPMYLVRLCNRRKIRSGKKIATQQEANEIWTNPEIDLPQRSARYVKTMLIVLIFAPIFPLGLPLGLISVTLQYWTDKILLLRRYSRSKTFGKGLALSVLQWFPIAVLCYSVFSI